MNMKIFWGILVIISFIIYIAIQYFVRKNFYKKNLNSARLWLEKRFLLILFFPRNYIQKNNFWKGYLIYLLSILFFILGLVFFVFYLKANGGINT
jgi:hypothetical protein